MTCLNILSIAKKTTPQIHLVSNVSFLLQHRNKYLINTNYVPYLVLERTVRERIVSVTTFATGMYFVYHALYLQCTFYAVLN